MNGSTPLHSARQHPNSYDKNQAVRRVSGIRTSTSDGRADQCIQFLVAADGELQMARGYALHAQVL